MNNTFGTARNIWARSTLSGRNHGGCNFGGCNHGGCRPGAGYNTSDSAIRDGIGDRPPPHFQPLERTMRWLRPWQKSPLTMLNVS